MGCCESADKSSSEGSILQILEKSIKSNSFEKLVSLIPRLKNSPDLFEQIKLHLIQHKGMSLTPLAYCLWEGYFESFKTLIEDFGFSVNEMEKNLENYSYSGISLLCEKNFSDILEFYIPIHLQQSTSEYKQNESEKKSIELTFTIGSKTRFIAPVHIACEFGNISALLAILNCFKDKESIPDNLNLHHKDELSGENCVLIACKTANFTLLKFLKDVVRADFSVKNSKGEGAIVVLLAAYKKSLNRSVYDCLVYLVEVAGVSLIDQYEEILLLAQGSAVIEYIEESLKNNGIETKKREIEKEFEGLDNYVIENEEITKNSQFLKGMSFDDSGRTALSSISYIEVTNDSISLFERSNTIT